MLERPDDVIPLPDDAQVPGEEPLDDDTGQDDGQKTDLGNKSPAGGFLSSNPGF